MTSRKQRPQALRRLAVLKEAQKLGVAAACRRAGMDRTSFYKWKARYAAEGLRGLVDRPPVHKTHPHATPVHVKESIIGQAERNPLWGARRIRRVLSEQGIEVSAPTISKVIKEAQARKVSSRRHQI